MFDIDGSKAQLWIDCLKKKVGHPTDLDDGSGVFMKVDQFRIPLVSVVTKNDYDTLPECYCLPQPKSSHLKIMVQGQMYLAFVTLILPEVIKDMGATTNPEIENDNQIAPGNDSDTEPDTPPEHILHDHDHDTRAYGA